MLFISLQNAIAQEGEDVGWGAAGGVGEILHQTYEIGLLVTFF